MSVDNGGKRFVRRSRRVLCCAVPLAAALAATAAIAQSDLTNPFAKDPAAQKGAELFGRNCQQCHNSRGKGGKAPSLIRGSWAPGGANSDGYMFMTIVGGRRGTEMGAWGTSLTPDEIWPIVTYLRVEAARAKLDDARDDDE